MTRQDAQRLEALSQLTSMVADRHLADLQRAQAETAKIRAAIARLDQAAAASDKAMTTDFRAMNGAELRWRKWQEKERAGYQRALARALAQEAELRQDAARAVGRNGVVGKLSMRAGR
ncbi:hypothetical protein [Actibacterium ureilyticum]|uniref:hypothetical protein n=1 Tax=Actibacterium ureilyticum TaxID=1590614 RepID=UPI000BAAC61E|nr:hypothetical protein [Actibacterium ureilyticum]